MSYMTHNLLTVLLWALIGLLFGGCGTEEKEVVEIAGPPGPAGPKGEPGTIDVESVTKCWVSIYDHPDYHAVYVELEATLFSNGMNYWSASVAINETGVEFQSTSASKWYGSNAPYISFLSVLNIQYWYITPTENGIKVEDQFDFEVDSVDDCIKTEYPKKESK